MFQGGVVELLIQVVSSWQVIVVTLAFILFVFIVNYAARSYHRPRSIKKPSFLKKKPKPAEGGADKKSPSSPKNSNDELGLEEK